jgi:hypothetical protein
VIGVCTCRRVEERLWRFVLHLSSSRGVFVGIHDVVWRHLCGGRVMVRVLHLRSAVVCHGVTRSEATCV